MTFLPLTNTPRDYAWGQVNGVSAALGRPGSGGPEAELWLGAHALSPTRIAGDAPWPDLGAWEEASGTSLPYLMKVLSADSALSLQAHPTPAQAREGYAREEAAGIPLTAFERNYKDPNAKPELIVATVDGFEALCGFREPAQTVAALAGFGDVPGIDEWVAKLQDGVRPAFTWLLSGEPEVAELVAAVTERAASSTGAAAQLVTWLAGLYPGDPGILTALMLNHVTLAKGEALWLPAGNIHAYLRGTGIELMGPSDNVLRGGLTPKHVDTVELERVLDFTPGPPPRLTPVRIADGAVAYRPASVPSGEGVGFELLLVDQDATLELPTPAIALALEGVFTLAANGEAVDVERGGIWFVSEPGELVVTGAGRLFIATGR